MMNQTFYCKTTIGKKILSAIWHIVAGGFTLMLIMGGLLQYSSPENSSIEILVGLLLLGGIIGIPGYAAYRWITTDNFMVTTDQINGFRIIHIGLFGNQTAVYKWQDIVETEMDAGTVSESGVHKKYTFQIFTAHESLKFPESMESFFYFVDVVNRATPHLRYSIEYVDSVKAREQNIESGWYKIYRK